MWNQIGLLVVLIRRCRGTVPSVGRDEDLATSGHRETNTSFGLVRVPGRNVCVGWDREGITH